MVFISLSLFEKTIIAMAVWSECHDINLHDIYSQYLAIDSHVIL